MRRLEVVYRPEAATDLSEVFDLVREASGSRDIAKRYVQRIQDRCRQMGDAPLAGVPRDDLAAGLRTAAFERRAVIAYRVVDETVEITNVFYGGRDFEALYGVDPPED